MKKSIFFISFILLFVLVGATIPSYAETPDVGNGYEFSLNYTGDIIKDEDKNASVILAGTNAVPYSNVRIKVDLISGPGTPTIVAYDSEGIGYNIIEIGYWGPPSGFQVGGTFTNETPVVAKFPEAGTYVIQLALIDLSNNTVITSKEFTQNVKENEPVVDNTTNNIVVNETNNTINAIEEIPQAGINIWMYILIISIVVVALILCRKYLIKK